MSPSSMAVTTTSVLPVEADMVSSKTFLWSCWHLGVIYLDRALGEIPVRLQCVRHLAISPFELLSSPGLHMWASGACSNKIRSSEEVWGALTSSRLLSTSQGVRDLGWRVGRWGLGCREVLHLRSPTVAQLHSLLDSLSALGVFTPLWPPSSPASLSSPPYFCFLGLNPKQTFCSRSLPQDLLWDQPRRFKTHGCSLRKINTFATWLWDREKKGFSSTIIWSLTDCLNHLDTLAFLPDWQPLPLQGPFPLSALLSIARRLKIRQNSRGTMWRKHCRWGEKTILFHSWIDWRSFRKTHGNNWKRKTLCLFGAMHIYSNYSWIPSW